MMQILLNDGRIDIDVTDNEGRTPFSDAVLMSRNAVLAVLNAFRTQIFPPTAIRTRGGKELMSGSLPEIVSFEDVATLNAATVVIVKRFSSNSEGARLVIGRGGEGGRELQDNLDLSKNNREQGIKWKVLLGQNVVKNWMRSTNSNTVIMRYPGEFKLPGGVAESQDLSIQDTALRELQEEFLGVNFCGAYPPSLHLFTKKLTIPIKNKRYYMHNFIAIGDENPWITEDLDGIINHNLEEKRLRFDAALESGEFWSLGDEEKSTLSPELVKVEWIELDEAILMMRGSLQESSPISYVNEWQREEFARYSLVTRDPMYQTMKVLEEAKELCESFSNMTLAYDDCLECFDALDESDGEVG